MPRILRMLLIVSACAPCLLAQSPVGGQGSIPTPQTKTLAIVVHFYRQNAAQQVLIRDPKGARIGKNALTGRSYHSAGNASYIIEGQGDLDNISTVVANSITFEDPLTGDYNVLLTSKSTGGFAVFVIADCESTVTRKQLIRQSFAGESTREFVVHFDPASCQAISIEPKQR